MTPPPAATLVVLTGGRSTRMGVDKAALDAGGIPLAARPAAALAGLCDDVVLAGRAVAGVPGRVVADDPRAAGPLAGILSGLGAARRRVCVVAACDMPSLHPGVVRLLLEALGRDPRAAFAVCARDESGTEPLPLAATRPALPLLDAAVSAGTRSIKGVLAALPLAVVPEAAWRALDPEGATFESWNTPADVRRLPDAGAGVAGEPS